MEAIASLSSPVADKVEARSPDAEHRRQERIQRHAAAVEAAYLLQIRSR